ncbi:MAG: LCP family protein [Roseiflexus sp.]|nr:LCP family protein [Roseiflexus sp.]MCS7290064.1 LCP family protein [Roseiflexus sp.]MDW8148503.1 LCP family protein [Roseiflexaceae bacterium]MDW8232167.1 LCP family protein [Roseiflexaceae bacterium]
MANDHQGRSIRGTTARERIAARRRARRSNRWFLFALSLVALAALALLTIGVTVLRHTERTLARMEQEDLRQRATQAALPPTSTMHLPTSPAPSPPPAPGASHSLLDRPFTVLLIGIDRRAEPDGGARSDTLILVRVDPHARTASMLSIPRDSVVPIPRLGWAKINTAYGYGYANATALYGDGAEPLAAGGALAAEAVEQFLGVTVDYIAQVDFRGFEQLIDSVGGVLIDVPAPILDAEYPTENYGVERIYIPAGLQVLDGRTALIYARTRHGSSDFDRSKRQQHVLRALFDQVRARGLLANASLLPHWIEVIARHVRTTLPISDLQAMTALAALARDLEGSRILHLSINPDDVAIDREDGSDIYWNPNDIAALVARWEAGPDTTTALPLTSLPTQVTAPDAPTVDPLQPTPTLLPSVAEPGTVVQVLNGARIEGIASQVSAFLAKRGFTVADPETVTRVYEHTLIIDYTGRPETRRLLAEALGINARYVLTPAPPDAPPPGYNVDIVVIIGRDYRQEWLNDGGR